MSDTDLKTNPLSSSLKTLVVRGRFAWRVHRTSAAVNGEQGLKILTVDQLAARLAGGFQTPIDSKSLDKALSEAINQPTGELETIQSLPGFGSAAAATLSKAWTNGLNLQEEASRAIEASARERLHSMARLEENVLNLLPPGNLRPGDLAVAATKRARHANALFGRIEIHGPTDLSLVWRPLLKEVATHTEVIWFAEKEKISPWLEDTNIRIEERPPANPTVLSYSCAEPQHEILEAFRWARRHLSRGIRPQDLAIATASPEIYDDYVLAMSQTSGIPVHFIHGRAAVETPEGQLTAALAEVLLQGFSRERIRRFVELLRVQSRRFEGIPPNWWKPPLSDMPLSNGPSWLNAIDLLNTDGESDYRNSLKDIILPFFTGIDHAQSIGNCLLEGKALGIWKQALIQGPPTALDLTLKGIRSEDSIEPGSEIVWGPAAALATAPRSYTWLAGLNSLIWPRRAVDDPLLPDQVIASKRLDPIPIPEADRSAFRNILRMTKKEVVCSYARRDSEGRVNGLSPLFPCPKGGAHLDRNRIAPHAASESDRLMARPREFKQQLTAEICDPDMG